jgi:hypothetical protein
MLVTLDRGFGDIRAYPPGSHPGIVVVSTSDESPSALAELLVSFLAEHDLTALAGPGP